MLARTLLAALLVALPCLAHQIDEMTMRIEASGGQFHARVLVDAAYMLPEFRGDEATAPQDLAWLRGRDADSWQQIRRETERYLRDYLAFEDDGKPVGFQVQFPDFNTDPPRFMTEGIAEMPPMLEVALDGDFTGRELQVSWREPLGVVLIVQGGEEVFPVISGETETILTREPSTGPHAAAPSMFEWVHLGFIHIVPGGLDHILFILGIFLLSPKWKPLLGQSLVFTLAHSLTLGLAALGIVELPRQPVEIGIALSIVWVAVENLCHRKPGGSRYFVVGAFGLVHGLGFASMLTQHLPADRPGAVVFGLVGFNLGVEAGQVLVLALAFGLFAWLSKPSFSRVRVVGSGLVALGGLLMLVSRLGGPTLIPGL